MRTGGLERLQDILDAELEILGELGHAGRPPGPGHHPLATFFDLQRKFLRSARNVHGPSEVAEITLEFTEDRWHGEGRERSSTTRVEPVDCFHEPEARHLKKIVERLVGAAVTARQLARKRQEAFNEQLPRALVTIVLPAAE